jgi:hypothetical protein
MRIAALLLCLISLSGRAGDLDKSSEEALAKTMEVLRSPTERGVEIKGSKRAQDADLQVKAVGGNAQNTEKIYELAAQVMENLVKEGAGDPDKMMQILDQAQKDPSAFANRFTPAQKKLLKELAADIEKSKGVKSVP